MYLQKEKKLEIFKKYGKDERDTGSSEAQIALFTYRIKPLDRACQEPSQGSCHDPFTDPVGRQAPCLTGLLV
jgi:small subunit ribosomal protein S15